MQKRLGLHVRGNVKGKYKIYDDSFTNSLSFIEMMIQ